MHIRRRIQNVHFKDILQNTLNNRVRMKELHEKNSLMNEVNEIV